MKFDYAYAADIPAELLAYYSALTSDYSWQLRRVETVDIVGASTVSRQSSIDIDMGVLRAVAASLGDSVDYIPVPVGFESKGLHLDLDIRSQHGDVLQLLPSGIDAVASFAPLSAWLDKNFKNHPCTDSVKDTLLEVARHHFDADNENEMYDFLEGGRDFLSIWKVPSDNYLLSGFFRVLLSYPEFLDLLIDASLRCYPMVLLPIRSGPIVTVKIRKLEAGMPPESSIRYSLGAFFGVKPAQLSLEDTSLGSAASAHVRVVSPPGVDFSDARITAWRIAPYRRVVNKDRVLLHATGAEFQFDERDIELDLWPQSRGFFGPSIATSFMGVVLLTIMLTASEYTRRFAQSNTEVLFAALVALPSVYAIFLSRSNEHDVRSILLTGLRRLLWVTATAHTLVLSALITNGGAPWLLRPAILIALIASGGAFFVLLCSWAQSRSYLSRVSSRPEFPESTVTFTYFNRRGTPPQLF